MARHATTRIDPAIVQYPLEEALTLHINHFLQTHEMLIVPDICYFECTDMLSMKCDVEKSLTSSEAEEFFNTLMSLPFTYVVTRFYLQSAFRIGITHSLAVYDSVYIALAKANHCALVTLDQRQRAAAVKEGVSVMQL